MEKTFGGFLIKRIQKEEEKVNPMKETEKGKDLDGKENKKTVAKRAAVGKHFPEGAGGPIKKKN